MINSKFALSESAVAKCLREIETYKSNLATKAEQFCLELSKIGIDAAYSILNTDYRVKNDTVTYTRESGTEYLVVAQGEQVAFIEFGVGVIGEAGGYPSEKLPTDWRYNAMWSPWAHDTDDPDRWFYYDDDGQLNNTKGTVPVGFMNNASETMRLKVNEIAKRVFA